MKLTPKSVAAAKLPAGKTDHTFFDDTVIGFGIRIRDSGKRVWIYRYRAGTKQRSLVLGNADAVPLKLARDNAAKMEAKVRLGGDPALEKQAAKLAVEDTFGALANRWLQVRDKDWRPKSRKQNTRHLQKYARPLHHLPIATVSQRQIAILLTDITKESGAVTANRVRTSICSFYTWVLQQGIRLPEGNVASYTGKHEERPRDRTLSDAELKTAWLNLPDDDFGAAIKLLILTGQREAEIGRLQWSEVHDEQIILPRERTKNDRAHTIPLSDVAKDIIAKFRGRSSRRHVFGRDDTGLWGWGHAKRRLDQLIRDSGASMPDWRIHDLRRTAVTGMANLGVQPHVIEAVVNHAGGHKAGVAGVYNLATYDKEKRDALNRWAEHVMAVVEGRNATVVPMRHV